MSTFFSLSPSGETTSSMACCNFHTHQPISMIFGRNVTDKVTNQKMLCFSISVAEAPSVSCRLSSAFFPMTGEAVLCTYSCMTALIGLIPTEIA